MKIIKTPRLPRRSKAAFANFVGTKVYATQRKDFNVHNVI